VTQFIQRQYTYQSEDIKIKPEPNDIVLDCGAFIGETAMFFAHETGPNGKVYSFEFEKGNIEIFNKNMSLNPDLASRIILIEHPVWENSETKLYYSNNGSASKIGFENFGEEDSQTMTISLDQMVLKYTLKRVDFIKMHIEGSELKALKGASETLKKYKPKLAISIYHNHEDFKRIPEFIKSISPEYELYLGHYSMNHEDTVLYAIHN
jgi:FkbM family methyltransferase